MLEAAAAASNARASASRAAANQSAADQLEAQKYRDKMKLAGLSGLESIYGSSPAELARYDDELYRNRALTQGGQQTNLNQRASYNPQSSAWDKAMQIGGLVVGGATGIVANRRQDRRPYYGPEEY